MDKGSSGPPDLFFRLIGLDEATLYSQVSVTGEYSRLPQSLGGRIWHVTLRYHDQHNSALTTITVPKLPQIAAPPAVLRIGLDEARNLAVARLMEITRNYALADRVEWQPSQVRLAGRTWEGRKTSAGDASAWVVDVGDLVGAVIIGIPGPLPDLIFMRHYEMVTWVGGDNT